MWMWALRMQPSTVRRTRAAARAAHGQPATTPRSDVTRGSDMVEAWMPATGTYDSPLFSLRPALRLDGVASFCRWPAPLGGAGAGAGFGGEPKSGRSAPSCAPRGRGRAGTSENGEGSGTGCGARGALAMQTRRRCPPSPSGRSPPRRRRRVTPCFRGPVAGTAGRLLDIPSQANSPKTPEEGREAPPSSTSQSENKENKLVLS